MKAITIKQPWASLIVEGIKDIENRTWKTNFRGKVLIHAAAKSWDWDRLINYMTHMGTLGAFTAKWTRKWLLNLPTGAIIGSVEIVDCVINHPSIWAEKTIYKHGIAQTKPIFNWVLTSPIKFDKPIPCKGKLSFWDYNGELPL